MWFAYDGEHIALRFDGTGSLTGRYLHGDAVDQIFAEEVGGQTRWTLTDHLGSVRDVLGDTGMTLGRITYDSFGQATNTTGIVDTLFRYTARPGIASTGLYDYRARTYDPHVGQFLSEDPIGFTAGDPNLRRYVGNEPTRWVDPLGTIQQRAYENWDGRERKKENDNSNKRNAVQSRSHGEAQPQPAKGATICFGVARFSNASEAYAILARLREALNSLNLAIEAYEKFLDEYLLHYRHLGPETIARKRADAEHFYGHMKRLRDMLRSESTRVHIYYFGPAPRPGAKAFCDLSKWSYNIFLTDEFFDQSSAAQSDTLLWELGRNVGIWDWSDLFLKEAGPESSIWRFVDTVKSLYQYSILRQQIERMEKRRLLLIGIL